MEWHSFFFTYSSLHSQLFLNLIWLGIITFQHVRRSTKVATGHNFCITDWAMLFGNWLTDTDQGLYKKVSIVNFFFFKFEASQHKNWRTENVLLQKVTIPLHRGLVGLNLSLWKYIQFWFMFRLKYIFFGFLDQTPLLLEFLMSILGWLWIKIIY